MKLAVTQLAVMQLHHYTDTQLCSYLLTWLDSYAILGRIHQSLVASSFFKLLKYIWHDMVSALV